MVGSQMNIKPSIIQNIEVEVLEITVDKLESKLKDLLPKTDLVSNWISVIGVFVTLVLGIVSYYCTEETHRPSLVVFIALIAFSIISLGAIVFLLYRSYTAVNASSVLENLKDGCIIISHNGSKKEYHSKLKEKGNKNKKRKHK